MDAFLEKWERGTRPPPPLVIEIVIHTVVKVEPGLSIRVGIQDLMARLYEAFKAHCCMVLWALDVAVIGFMPLLSINRP